MKDTTMAADQDFQYDVFLSHSAKDKAVVRPLAERLRADGPKVWFDEWVLKPGDSIPASVNPFDSRLAALGARSGQAVRLRPLAIARSKPVHRTPASGQFLQAPQIAAGQGEFLGARPALELEFAPESRLLVGKKLGVKQLKRWGIGRCLAPASAPVFPQAPIQIASGSDIKTTVLEAKDVNEVSQSVTLKLSLFLQPFDFAQDHSTRPSYGLP